jgi:hypothetical protein
MRKPLAVFGILCLALFAAGAFAQHGYQTYNLNQSVQLTAQIDQTASLSCPGAVFFDVKDPSVATNGDQDVHCTAKVSLHRGGVAAYSMSNTVLTGTESGGVIPADLIWAKTNLSAGYGPVDGSGFYPLTFAPTAGTLNHEMDLTFTFQLQPVPTFAPDIYTGTATILLQVV